MEERTASTSTGQWSEERTPSTSTQGQDTSQEYNTTEEYTTAEEGTDGEVANHGEEPTFYPVFSDTEEETEVVLMTPRAGVVYPRRMSI